MAAAVMDSVRRRRKDGVDEVGVLPEEEDEEDGRLVTRFVDGVLKGVVFCVGLFLS